MSAGCRVAFTGGSHPAVAVPPRARLFAHLTAVNSPLLFGCRTGVCGTCLVRVAATSAPLAPPSPEEREVLDLFAPDDPQARLACQLELTCDVTLDRHPEAPT